MQIGISVIDVYTCSTTYKGRILSILNVYTKPNVSFKFGSLDKGCVEMRTKKGIQIVIVL